MMGKIINLIKIGKFHNLRNLKNSLVGNCTDLVFSNYKIEVLKLRLKTN